MFFEKIKSFIWIDDEVLLVSIPLFVLIFSLIMIFLSFKIIGENWQLKTSYWINILLSLSPFILFLKQYSLCQTKWCAGYEPIIAFDVSLIISSGFIIISFILFIIGYRKQRVVPEA
jgi:TRAP-type C4-dicarboxylate transport system permease small subunit